MIEDPMYVDLSRMKELPRCAIMCRTEDDVRLLFYNGMKQLSKHMSWRRLEDILIAWDVYGEKTGFTLFYAESTAVRSMSYCREDWFKENGYEIVEFSSLTDTTDIDESDVPPNFLFGGII